VALEDGKAAWAAGLGRQVQDLVRRMANENGWGAPRIHGELVKLGFRVSERTVSRYMRQHRRRPERRQNWLTFLRNHREVIVAMDFFVVPTATFRLLYVWFAIRHSRREIVHWCVTESPTAPWVVQQLREAFPFDEASRGSRYLVFDRDTISSAEVVAAVASMAIEPTRTSYQSPWQNGVAERFVGTVRRELLDHAIVLDDRHLRRLLNEYLGLLPRGPHASRRRQGRAAGSRCGTEPQRSGVRAHPTAGWRAAPPVLLGRGRVGEASAARSSCGRGKRLVGEEARRSATDSARVTRRPARPLARRRDRRCASEAFSPSRPD